MRTLLIKNGFVIDGTGTPGVNSDILISGNKIIRVGHFNDSSADEVIDVSGLTVTPGFIDIHTHFDLQILSDRQYFNGLSQGVTSIIVGLCGIGFAPCPTGLLLNNIRYSKGICGYCPSEDYSWNTFDQYLGRLSGSAVNVSAAATHTAARLCGSGFADRPLKGAELDRAKDSVRESFESGASAFSTGLAYYPQGYSDTEELTELCKVVKDYNGVVMVHMRPSTEGFPLSPAGEVAHVAMETGVKIHILHYKTLHNYHCGEPEMVFEPFRKAVDAGCDISYEYYPYYCGSSYGLMPFAGWVSEGGYEAALARLKDMKLRQKIIDDSMNGFKEICRRPGSPIVLSHLPATPEYIGMTMRQAADIRGEDDMTALINLLIENELEVLFVWREPDDPDIRSRLKRDMLYLLDTPSYTIGSDSIPVGVLPHPRLFGCYGKMLRLVRGWNYPLEKYIRKVTGYCADRFDLPDIGYIKEGKRADLAIFDYEEVRDNATFQNPIQPCDGFKYVIVGGQPALIEGRTTGLFNGEALRRKVNPHR